MAVAALSQELDPLFLKSITLLHSKHPDSANQLKNLAQSYREKILGNVATKKIDGRQSPHVDVNKSLTSVRIQPVTTAMSSGNAVDAKRALSPSSAMVDSKFTGEDKKIIKTNPLEESIEEITVGSSLQPGAKRKKKSTYDNMLGLSSPDSDPNDSIPIDQIIEMDFGGPTCTICHLSKSVEEDNALVECCECHSSYHQKCHKPNVTTKELNDPRLIWYCSKCVKKMKKEMAAQQASNKPTVVETTAPPKALSNPFQQSKPFRRISTLQTSSPENAKLSAPSNTTTPQTLSNEQPAATSVYTEDNPSSSSREGSPSLLSNKHNRSRDMARHAMNRLEQVKKRAKLQQALKQTRK